MKKLIIGVILSILIVLLLAYIVYIQYDMPKAFLEAAGYAIILNLINFTTAILLFNKAIKKSNQQFMILNFGGMIIRLLILLSSIIIFIKLFNLHKVGFISVFFVIYFVFLTFEINHFRINAAKNRNYRYVK